MSKYVLMCFGIARLIDQILFLLPSDISMHRVSTVEGKRCNATSSLARYPSPTPTHPHIPLCAVLPFLPCAQGVSHVQELVEVLINLSLNPTRICAESLRIRGYSVKYKNIVPKVFW